MLLEHNNTHFSSRTKMWTAVFLHLYIYFPNFWAAKSQLALPGGLPLPPVSHSQAKSHRSVSLFLYFPFHAQITGQRTSKHPWKIHNKKYNENERVFPTTPHTTPTHRQTDGQKLPEQSKAVGGTSVPMQNRNWKTLHLWGTLSYYRSSFDVQHSLNGL